MPIPQAMSAFWGMTINNYTDTDLALLQHAYPDHIRRIVHTLERGEKTGTPHVQAYVRLFRQQRMSYMRKLFPSATDFKCLNSEEWVLNAERYAQKQDGTAESPSVITNNPVPDPITELTEVIRAVLAHWTDTPISLWRRNTARDMFHWMEREEYQRVRERPALAKFYVSAVYKAVKKTYWDAICEHLADEEAKAKKLDTHTHTHTPEKNNLAEGVNNDAEDDEVDSQESGSLEQEDTEGEDYEDDYSEASEGPDESGSSCCSEEDAGSEYGE